jgi:hypothetical protein
MNSNRTYTVRLLVLVTLGIVLPRAAQSQSASANNVRSTNQIAAPPFAADPSSFVELYENSLGKEQLRYDSADVTKQGRNIKVDSASTLVVKIRKDRLNKDTAINQLLITAQLASGDKTTAIQVAGYSEIGKDQTSGNSQTAVSIQIASQISAVMQNFYWTAKDIIDQGISVACREYIEKDPANVTFTNSSSNPCALNQDGPTLAKTAKSVFLVYRDGEAKKIPAFFGAPANAEVVAALGDEIFGMDLQTIQAIGSTFPNNVDALFLTSTTPDGQADAARILFSRVLLSYRDFQMSYQSSKQESAQCAARSAAQATQPCAEKCSSCTKAVKNVDDFFHYETDKLVDKLKDNVVSGQIDLLNSGAKDGDTVTIKIESKAIGRDGTSAVLQLNILVRNYGYRVATSPSMLFIRRIGVTEADQATQNLTAVRFAPSPGVTFGVTLLPRHPKLLSALAPGLGVNLSFMNYNDPRDYNLSSGTFKNTTPVNVQFGTGVVVSLFNNMIQTTYGWNLNAPQRRTYWGIGFGFFDVAKYFAKQFGK